MSAFALSVAHFAEKAGQRAEDVTRKIVIELFSRVVLKSPVDTGRFRANWQFGLQQVGVTSNDTDPSGAAALGRITSGVASTPLGTSMWLSNSLPYARRLEYGWSKQAPAGMVRVSIAEFQDIVRDAVRQ